GGHQRRSAQYCIVLAMLAVQGRGKRARLIAIRAQTWEEAREVTLVVFKSGGHSAQIRFFGTNDGKIDDEEHRAHDSQHPKAAGSDGKTERHDQRAEVKRVARVGVRAGGGEFLVLLYMA